MLTAKRKTILVVDDEEIIREFLGEVLGEDYEVYRAGDGDEAIAQLSQQTFDLVITDMKMPRLSGEEVVKYVAKFCPGTPVVIISGYTTLYAVSQSVSHGACAFLSKPFTIDDLTRTVEDILSPHA